MDLKSLALAVLLFFVLSPSVLVRLPSKGDKYVVAGTHALVFGILFYFINSLVSFEGFVEGAANRNMVVANDGRTYSPENPTDLVCNSVIKNTATDKDNCNNKNFYFGDSTYNTHKCEYKDAKPQRNQKATCTLKDLRN